MPQQFEEEASVSMPQHLEDATKDNRAEDVSSSSSGAVMWTSLKLIAAAALCWSAYSSRATHESLPLSSSTAEHHQQRRLTEEDLIVPSPARSSPLSKYLTLLFQDLRKREKLFEETPAEEVKYWFEYTDPLQVGSVSLRQMLWTGRYNSKL
jgi:hypothetical protein